MASPEEAWPAGLPTVPVVPKCTGCAETHPQSRYAAGAEKGVSPETPAAAELPRRAVSPRDPSGGVKTALLIHSHQVTPAPGIAPRWDCLFRFAWPGTCSGRREDASAE